MVEADRREAEDALMDERPERTFHYENLFDQVVVMTPPDHDRMTRALLTVFLDPLGSHGARALARDALGITFIPFAAAEEMLTAHVMGTARREGKSRGESRL